MTNSETVASRPEAEELRTRLLAMPELSGAVVMIKNAKPLPTVDEALMRLKHGFREYPVLTGKVEAERLAG